MDSINIPLRTVAFSSPNFHINLLGVFYTNATPLPCTAGLPPPISPPPPLSSPLAQKKTFHSLVGLSLATKMLPPALPRSWHGVNVDDIIHSPSPSQGASLSGLFS